MMFTLLLPLVIATTTTRSCSKDSFTSVHEHTTFTLPPLPYGYNALNPTISETTMYAHHDHHHQVYVDKLNEYIAETPELEGKSIIELLDIALEHETLEKHAGGHYNHSLFWWLLICPTSSSTFLETGTLMTDIETAFGSYSDF
jgi:Fe-Mn family superoxide dismutase